MLSHASQHDNANDAILALEAKVGVNSSAVTTSIDYLLKSSSSINPGHLHSLTAGVTGTLPVANGGSGATTLTGILLGNGTSAFTALSSSGTGNVVRVAGATLTTPALGVATATSINGLTLTTSTGTFSLTNAKTLTVSDSTTLANSSITFAAGGVITFPASTATAATLTDTQTFTNKRITARILSATSYTTNTGSSLNGDTQDMFIVTAQTGALLFNNPTGTPTDGQKLIITVASSTTAARALTWDTAFGSTTVTLPTTTTATTATLSIGFIWSASKSLWQCVAVA